MERLDYTDAGGRAPSARWWRIAGRRAAMRSPATWTPCRRPAGSEDPWAPRLDAEGVLHGLGSVDMKGPLAACILAARSVPEDVPATLLITTDEETTKAGARAVAGSALARRARPAGASLVAEPTGLVPVRGHRASVNITATAERGAGAFLHRAGAATPIGTLIPFLAEMRALSAAAARTTRRFHDAAYDPPFSDFNLVLDNHGTAVNVTVPRATCRIKFRRSRGLGPAPVLEAVRAAAERAGRERWRSRAEGQAARTAGRPPAGAPLRRAHRQGAGAPCPSAPTRSSCRGWRPASCSAPATSARAHTPEECVPLAELAAAVPLMARFLVCGAASA